MLQRLRTARGKIVQGAVRTREEKAIAAGARDEKKAAAGRAEEAGRGKNAKIATRV